MAYEDEVVWVLRPKVMRERITDWVDITKKLTGNSQPWYNRVGGGNMEERRRESVAGQYWVQYRPGAEGDEGHWEAATAPLTEGDPPCTKCGGPAPTGTDGAALKKSIEATGAKVTEVLCPFCAPLTEG